MSSQMTYNSPWLNNRQGQNGNGQQTNQQGNGQTQNMGTQGQGGLPGGSMFQGGYQSQYQGTGNQGGAQGYSHMPSAMSPYPDTSMNNMQYMVQMMINVGNQMNKLTELIAKNNQLLQTLHEQGDTKCVQGNGGGSIIVRM